MSLSWRDAIATIIIAGVGVLTYAKLSGVNVPLLGNWRLSTLALLLLGFATCVIVGWDVTPSQNAWTAIASTLGVFGLLVGVAGLIFESKFLFVSLAVDITALWVVATLHHLLVGGGN